MRLSKGSALGVFAAIHLAEWGGSAPIQVGEMARSFDVSVDSLVEVLQQLVRARILHSRRGPAGGFTLHKPPREITLLEIVEAVDGPLDGSLPRSGRVKGKEKARERIELACMEAATYCRGLLANTCISDLAEPPASG